MAAFQSRLVPLFAAKLQFRARRRKHEERRNLVLDLAAEQGVELELPSKLSNDVDISRQGNLEFYEKSAMEARDAIRRHPRLRQESLKWWELLCDDDETVPESAYVCAFSLAFKKLFGEQITSTKLLEMAREDWAEDSHDKTSMDLPTFMYCLFEFADVWVNSLDLSDYVSFLRQHFDVVAAHYEQAKAAFLQGSESLSSFFDSAFPRKKRRKQKSKKPAHVNTGQSMKTDTPKALAMGEVSKHLDQVENSVIASERQPTKRQRSKDKIGATENTKEEVPHNQGKGSSISDCERMNLPTREKNAVRQLLQADFEESDPLAELMEDVNYQAGTVLNSQHVSNNAIRHSDVCQKNDTKKQATQRQRERGSHENSGIIFDLPDRTAVHISTLSLDFDSVLKLPPVARRAKEPLGNNIEQQQHNRHENVVRESRKAPVFDTGNARADDEDLVIRSNSSMSVSHQRINITHDSVPHRASDILDSVERLAPMNFRLNSISSIQESCLIFQSSNTNSHELLKRSVSCMSGKLRKDIVDDEKMVSRKDRPRQQQCLPDIASPMSEPSPISQREKEKKKHESTSLPALVNKCASFATIWRRLPHAAVHVRPPNTC
jgi:hypothetical protein